VVAVTPVLQELIDAYDATVAAILADPRVASQPGHELVLAYLSLFPEDSSFASGTLEFWASEGELGRFYQPGPRGEMYASAVGSVVPDSADQVTFTVCTVKSIVIVDSSGSELSAEGGVTAGSVIAIRSEGVWHLRDLTRTSAEGCPNP